MRRSTFHISAAAVAIAATLAACASPPTKTVSTATTATAGLAQEAADPVAEEPDPEPTPEVSPLPSNYEVRTKVTSKECFGSAGCLVDVSLRLSVDPIVVGIPVDVTVQVTGDEDGPVIETLSVDEDGKYDAPTVDLDTKRSSTKIRVKVTEVETTS